MTNFNRRELALLSELPRSVDEWVREQSHQEKLSAAQRWAETHLDQKMPRFDRRFVPWYLRRFIPKDRFLALPRRTGQLELAGSGFEHARNAPSQAVR